MLSSRPATLGLGVGLYLAGVFLFALNDALGKWLVGGLIGAATTPFAWASPGAFDLILMALVGIMSMFCFVLITRALALPAPPCSRRCNLRRSFGRR